MRQNFRFSGTGGQGLITAGIILAEAAILDGRLAVQSQSYGPEARGGSSKADEPIYFGRVTHPDTLLVMSQEAADKFSGDCDADSLVITDSLFVKGLKAKDSKRIDIPITHTAREVCGKPLFANIVALGAVVALTKCVSKESLEKAVLGRVPKGTEDANRKALAAGYSLVDDH